ncbi:MAG: TfoX/Sxy family protein, partial [bacterium]|nr:TfoX/Sxy family protein [bacterium]
KMFGGHGIFCDQKMFLIVDSAGSAFFKVTDSTRVKFEEHHSVQHSKMPYFSIPDVVLNDSANLKEWALMVIQSID